MKVRLGFVSNSSSASFILRKKGLTREQLDAIRDHEDITEDPWDLTETKNYIFGSTFMDNFDMEEFLRELGVSVEEFEVEGDTYGSPDTSRGMWTEIDRDEVLRLLKADPTD